MPHTSGTTGQEKFERSPALFVCAPWVRSSVSCVPFSSLPMIYQYFWRVKLAKSKPE